MLKAVAPELLPLEATPQDPAWHPEGDVWTHTLQVVDEAAGLLDDLGDDRPRQLAVMLGALCHDLGKPPTTRFEDGRIRSRGHEEAGLAPTRALLDRWNVHALLGYDVREQVLALVAHHLKPGQLYDERDRVGDGAIRRLARQCEPDLLYRVAKADCLGRRPGVFEPVAMEWFRERVRALDVAVRPPDADPEGTRPHRPGGGAGTRDRPGPPGRLREAARRCGHDARRGAGGGSSGPGSPSGRRLTASLDRPRPGSGSPEPHPPDEGAAGIEWPKRLPIRA